MKVGDKVKIVDNTSSHRFKIGEHVRVLSIGSMGIIKAEKLDRSHWFYLNRRDIEPIIHPFTQWLTNEIAKADGSMDIETLQIVLLEFNKH